jgi:uncharacterized protein YkwD
MAAKKTLLRLALPLAAVAAMVAPATASATSCPNANVSAGSVSYSAFNEAVLCLLNEQRTNNGLAPVVSNDELASSAVSHSSEMRLDSYFAHDSANGSSFSDRIAATGYLRGASRWVVGENIAWGSLTLGTPQALMVAWMNSPEHRANILDPTFDEIGVGTVWGSPINPNLLSAAIVTTDFGSVKRGAKAKKAKKVKKSKRARRARKAARQRLQRSR